MNIKIKGEIIHIGELQEFPSGFKKRLVVVKSDEHYPQEYPVEFVKEKADAAEQFTMGQVMEVDADIRCREWNGKWFPNIQAWKWDAGSVASPEPEPGPEPFSDSDDQEDIPF